MRLKNKKTKKKKKKKILYQKIYKKNLSEERDDK